MCKLCANCWHCGMPWRWVYFLKQCDYFTTKIMQSIVLELTISDAITLGNILTDVKYGNGPSDDPTEIALAVSLVEQIKQKM